MSCTDCQRAFPSGWWKALASPNRCGQVACAACGVIQCHGHGAGRGACSVCRYGRLDGWSFSGSPSTCQYKGCNEPVVYSGLPGAKRHACKAHGDALLAKRKKA